MFLKSIKFQKLYLKNCNIWKFMSTIFFEQFFDELDFFLILDFKISL